MSALMPKYVLLEKPNDGRFLLMIILIIFSEGISIPYSQLILLSILLFAREPGVFSQIL